MSIVHKIVNKMLEQGEAFRADQAKDREGNEDMRFAFGLMSSQYLENGAL